MRSSAILLSLALLCPYTSLAQLEAISNYDDAIRLSHVNPTGTARIQGMAGAQNSLGGDLSSASSNPAGLGFFNRSVFEFTPTVNVSSSSASYFDDNSENFESGIGIGHMGIAFHHGHSDDGSGFRGGTFAISFARSQNSRYNITVDARNNNSSVIDSYISLTQGIFPDDLRGTARGAYDHFVIDAYNSGNGIAYDSFIFGLGRQSISSIAHNRQSRWDFSYGGNFNDRFYFGLNAGINSVNYSLKKTHVESDFIYDQEPEGILDFLESVSDQNVNGLGVGSTIGIIFRPVDPVTIGLSAKTPVFYSLANDHSWEYRTNFFDYDYIREEGDESTTYHLEDYENGGTNYAQFRARTPWITTFGASYFIGKAGFITADIDYIDYSKTKIATSDYSPDTENESISNFYDGTFNFRIGAEARFSDMRARIGFGRLGDPIRNDSFNASVNNLTFGLGYRNQNMFLDAAVVNSTYNTKVIPYEINDIMDERTPFAEVKNNNTTVSFTIGFNF